MALTYWWLLPLGVVGRADVFVIFWRRHEDAATLIPVANTERLTALPTYRKAVRQRRAWLLTALVAVAVLGLSLLTAAARPVTESTSIPERQNRDIMLCLDVSNSMLDTDEAIATMFAKLVGNFKGERIGLTIFDSSSVMVFPLTADYEFVAEELNVAQKALGTDAGSFEYFAGTYEMPGSSLIGDSLASCAKGFPPSGAQERSRSIVLATDNMLAGKPIFTLAEATTLASTAKMRVYALNPNDFGLNSLFGAAAENLKKTATATGGAYHALESESAVASIVSKVQATEAATLKRCTTKNTT